MACLTFDCRSTALHESHLLRSHAGDLLYAGEWESPLRSPCEKRPSCCLQQEPDFEQDRSGALLLQTPSLSRHHLPTRNRRGAHAAITPRSGPGDIEAYVAVGDRNLLAGQLHSTATGEWSRRLRLRRQVFCGPDAYSLDPALPLVTGTLSLLRSRERLIWPACAGGSLSSGGFLGGCCAGSLAGCPRSPDAAWLDPGFLGV